MVKKNLRVCHKFLMGNDGYDLSIQDEIKATSKHIDNYVLFFIDKRYFDLYVQKRDLKKRGDFYFHPYTRAYVIPIFYERVHGNYLRDFYLMKNVKSFVKQFKEVFRAIDPDVVHVHGTLTAQFMYAAFYSRLRGVKCVSTHHIGKINTSVENQKKHIIYFKYLFHNLFPFVCNHVICKSECGKGSFLIKKNISKISGAINLECENISLEELNKFLSEKNVFSRKVDLSKSSFFIYPARFCNQKNQKILIDVFKELKDQDVRLILVGYADDKFYYNSLIEKIKEEGLEDVVYVLPEINNKKLLAIMKHCSFLIYPSINENMPRACFEAFALGLPILASFDSGHKEYLIEGKNGYFFYPKDKDSIIKAIKKGIQNRNKIIPEKSNRNYVKELLKLYEMWL